MRATIFCNGYNSVPNSLIKFPIILSLMFISCSQMFGSDAADATESTGLLSANGTQHVAINIHPTEQLGLIERTPLERLQQRLEALRTEIPVVANLLTELRSADAQDAMNHIIFYLDYLDVPDKQNNTARLQEILESAREAHVICESINQLGEKLKEKVEIAIGEESPLVKYFVAGKSNNEKLISALKAHIERKRNLEAVAQEALDLYSAVSANLSTTQELPLTSLVRYIKWYQWVGGGVCIVGLCTLSAYLSHLYWK